MHLSNCLKSLKCCINVRNNSFYCTDQVLLVGNKVSPEYDFVPSQISTVVNTCCCFSLLTLGSSLEKMMFPTS